LQQPSGMDVREFEYHLPRERIAQFPSEERDQSRLLVLERDTGRVHHALFHHLAEWLDPGDLLVLNDTRVIPARLRGRRRSGGSVELLLLEPLSPSGETISPTGDPAAFRARNWTCLVRCRGRLREGEQVAFGDGVCGELRRHGEEGWSVEFSGVGDLRELMGRLGEMPLPPYIRRPSRNLDEERYQTLYAKRDGSVAAPTAGLHFTDRVFRELHGKGVRFAFLTLQVGVGTFSPVKVQRVEDHRMHPEYVEVGQECCRAWDETRRAGGRVIAVGTTTVRALESAVDEEGNLRPFRGYTSLFIFPGHLFRAVDGLVTNFHLPRSTLLMLVVAFGGRDPVMGAYREAIERGYRFYSYGDAMLIR